MKSMDVLVPEGQPSLLFLRRLSSASRRGHFPKKLGGDGPVEVFVALSAVFGACAVTVKTFITQRAGCHL